MYRKARRQAVNLFAVPSSPGASAESHSISVFSPVPFGRLKFLGGLRRRRSITARVCDQREGPYFFIAYSLPTRSSVKRIRALIECKRKAYLGLIRPAWPSSTRGCSTAASRPTRKWRKRCFRRCRCRQKWAKRCATARDRAERESQSTFYSLKFCKKKKKKRLERIYITKSWTILEAKSQKQNIGL
jgi:hypothetical protein